MPRPFGLLSALATAFAAAATPAAACVYDPNTNVYASACATTANREQGQAYFRDSGGTLQATSTTDGSTNTDPVRYQTPGSPLPALNGTATESTARATMSGFGQIGSLVSGTYEDVGFANGNPVVSARRIRGSSLVPNLHASAEGSAFDGYSVAAGDARFSDVISIGQAQLDYLNRVNGKVLAGVHVILPFFLQGTATATGNLPSGSNSEAYGQFIFTAVSPRGAVAGGSFSRSLTISNTAAPVEPGVAGTLYIEPGYTYVLNAALVVHGDASSKNDEALDYKAGFADTAAFLGARFYADADLTEQLPTLQLNSAYGFNYDPILQDDATAVPEPGSASLLLVAAVAATALRRRTTG